MEILLMLRIMQEAISNTICNDKYKFMFVMKKSNIDSININSVRDIFIEIIVMLLIMQRSNLYKIIEFGSGASMPPANEFIVISIL
jgi:hypothetical protein